jgi:hypothetical protein
MSAVLLASEIYETPAEHISALMQQRIQRYCDSRLDPSLYQSVRNMSQFVSDDYGGRFLLELIQNAHDAHDPSRKDGEIAVCLNPSMGDHGCLYVANRGRGFMSKNLRAITNIALSSKSANAGIGNKGLGFRSVLQICNWPEIYSIQESGGRGFDGYCFRFAMEEDLRDVLGPDSVGLAQEMAETLPCWHVPVVAHPGPDVARFATDGFATVVRLPLKSHDALMAVRAQIDLLLGLTTPLHLFLDRVGRISIDSGDGSCMNLDRATSQTWIHPPRGFKVDAPLKISKLRLGNDEFALAQWDVDEKIFRSALKVSLEKGQVPESWKNWEGAAQISVAVPLGKPLDCGRLYCFLPLDSAGKSPLPAHINANFYTKLDRRSVDTSVRLNHVFMQMAVFVSCQLVDFLVKERWPEAPGAVASLLCWDDEYLGLLREWFGDAGQGILLREILPVRAEDGRVAWASPKDTYGWIGAPDDCLSPGRISEVAGGKILVDTLTPNQRTGLNRVYLNLRGIDFTPPAQVVADWVEKVAARLHEENTSPARWGLFYDEVAAALSAQPSVLFGKRFLLSVSGDLISSELPAAGPAKRVRRAADVYFPPVMTIDADVDDDDTKNALPLETLPATLRRGFALLSRDVPWLKEDGGHRLARTFLTSGKLAREYDTRDVLRTLAGVTRDTGGERMRFQALEWAFRLWNSGRSLSDKETRAAGFFVPATAGWIPAETAMFGAGWDVPNGNKLQTLLRLGAGDSRDLHESLSRLLPEFSAWPIRHGTQVDWLRFLTAAGITDCLRPLGGESIVSQPSGYPSNLPPAVSRTVAGLAEPLRAHWLSQLTRDCRGMYTSRQYRAEVRQWRIPGQKDVEKFPLETRRDYAVQVMLAMRNFGDEHYSFRAVRENGSISTEQHRLCTPLFAFLTGGEWIPVQRPGSPPRFVRPASAWYFDDDGERPPRFLEFISHQVAAAIDPGTLRWLHTNAQIGLFNDDRDAARALLALTDAASNRISDVRDVRRFQDTFRRLWAKARESGQPGPASAVPVMIGGAIDCVRQTGGEIKLAYFDDERDALKMQLLEEVGDPVFDFIKGDSAAVWKWINASTPGKFRRISDEPVDVFVDGKKFDDSVTARLLSDVVGMWIIDFLVCVAEHKATSFVHTTQNSLGRIRRAAMGLVLVTGREIQIAHGDDVMALPEALRGALTLNRPSGPVLIVETPNEAPSLDLLAGASAQLAVALGARELANGLDAALLRLAGVLRNHPGESPDDLMISMALGIDTGAIKRTRRLACGDLISLLDFAVPLSACLASSQTTLRLQELSISDDPAHDDIRAGLEDLSTELNVSLSELEERLAGLVDLRDLKDEFELTTAGINAAIVGLNTRLKPVSNEHFHRDAWSRHLRLRQPMAMDRLRERSVAKFDSGEVLTQYASSRAALLTAAPDVSWFTVHDELPESVMDAHLQLWIEGNGPHVAADLPLDLALDECRSLNGARLRLFCSTFAPVLSAWVRTYGALASIEVRQTWADPANARETCFETARDGGWLDFRLLDDEAIARWLALSKIWPAGRTANPELEAWDLSSSTVADNEARAKAEKAELQRRRSQLEFGGTTLSALKDGYASLAAAVAANLSKATALEHVSSTETILETMDPAKASGGSGGGTGRGVPKTPESGMSDEQKMAVGLIGELWAREWIRRRHQLQVSDENIWVSCYRDTVLNTAGGWDGWGFDFTVTTKSRTYYYEVKASTGDPRRFEMGPTEIGAAQRYRKDREHQYRVLYLAYVTDPERMTMTLLANPFSEKGDGKFRAVGKGSVTYEFEPGR